MKHEDLGAFMRWCDEQGIEHRPGKGQYEVLQIFYGDGWRRIWKNGYDTTLKLEKHIEHLSEQCFPQAKQHSLLTK